MMEELGILERKFNDVRLQIIREDIKFVFKETDEINSVLSGIEAGEKRIAAVG